MDSFSVSVCVYISIIYQVISLYIASGIFVMKLFSSKIYCLESLIVLFLVDFDFMQNDDKKAYTFPTCQNFSVCMNFPV